MSYETLSFAVADGVATITLNRPDKRNALGPPAWEDLPRVMDALSEDAERLERAAGDLGRQSEIIEERAVPVPNHVDHGARD